MFIKKSTFILMNFRQLICTIFLFGVSISLIVAQQVQHQVRGKILNEKGEPLEGVTVTVLGNTHSVSSYAQGIYSITVEATGERG